MQAPENLLEQLKSRFYTQFGGCPTCLPPESWEEFTMSLGEAVESTVYELGFDELRLDTKDLILNLKLSCPICGNTLASIDSPVGRFGTDIFQHESKWIQKLIDEEFEEVAVESRQLYLELEIDEAAQQRKKRAKDFFKESKEQSRIKTEIVSNYFKAYATVMVKNSRRYPLYSEGKIGYVDLFAGAGRYEDGTDSTPLLILKHAIDDSDLCEMLVTVFNDSDLDNVIQLTENIKNLENIEKLQSYPIIENARIGPETINFVEQFTELPTLFFADPFGIKGLSLQLLNAFLKEWGSDCIFFFNYNRVQMMMGNSLIKGPLYELFGKERTESLRKKIKSLEGERKEATIVGAFLEALLTDTYGKHIVKFRFKFTERDTTSHFLIFASKSFLGYSIMKDIMGKCSSHHPQGVPSFEYNPHLKNTEEQERIEQLPLFSSARKKGPLDRLKEELVRIYAGKIVTVKHLFKDHGPGTDYILANYKLACKQLEEQGLIVCEKRVQIDKQGVKRTKSFYNFTKHS